MHPVLILGISIALASLLGRMVQLINLPRVTGYVIAGLILNPTIFQLVPDEFVAGLDPLLEISLCVITFSVGGTLSLPGLRKSGSSILSITVFEAVCAFIFVAAGMFLIMPHLSATCAALPRAALFSLALLLGGLASPTDPSATLAVAHEFKAKGPVSDTILGIAALDDAVGIVNFGIAVAVAGAVVSSASDGINVNSMLVAPLSTIALSVAIGLVFGFIFRHGSKGYVEHHQYGDLIVILVATLATCFGVTQLINGDALLATMVVGVVVTNFHPSAPRVFKVLENNVEPIVFILFFTFSSMQLQFHKLVAFIALIPAFVLFRALGKFVGCAIGGRLTNMPRSTWIYVPGGLIPQGGIVVGLALLLKQNPAFAGMSSMIVNLIIGATVFHELFGPVIATKALRLAGELSEKK